MRSATSLPEPAPRAADLATAPGLRAGKSSPGGADPAEPALRVAVVSPIPTPYRDPFWSELAAVPGIALNVYYCASGKDDRPWKGDWRRPVDAEVLPGWNLLRWRGADASCFWNPAIIRRLATGDYDAILIDGYNHLTMIAALVLSAWRNVPFFLMCESHSKSARGGWRRRLKQPLLRWIVKHAAGLLPTGRLAADYLASFGGNRERMTCLPNVPDIAHLETEAARLRSRGDFPGPERFAGRPLILFVARLIPKKRAELLIRAFGGMHAGTNAVLAIIGDGPLRTGLEQLVRDLGLEERVHFAGFLPPQEVIRWYAGASLFVLPSSETWGVVVIEALSTGVRVIVSDEAGCHPDVVTDPALGSVVPARDEAALRAALQEGLSARRDSEGFHRQWALTSARLRYDVQAEALVRGLQRGVQAARERRSTPCTAAPVVPPDPGAP